jgi:CubicO group peptidase (beta-lactamase class C family)
VSWNRFGVEPDSSEAFDAADFAWAVTEDGITNGCCMLKLTPSDMVKIGRLYLDVGRWQGQQIVLAEWVQLATTPSDTNNQYGLFDGWRPSAGARRSPRRDGMDRSSRWCRKLGW